MALPNVSITLTTGNLGLVPATNDAVAGLVLQGPAATGLAVGTSTFVTSLAAAEALGIDAAYDTANSVSCYKHIKEFYDEAGTGAELWLIILSTALSLQSICDTANAYAKKLLTDAGGRIRILGVTRSPAGGYTPNTTANQIDVDVINALVTAQVLATEMFNAFKPVRILLPAYAFTGTASTLKDLKTLTSNRCAVVMGDTVTGAGAAIGLALGRFAAIPVQRNIGRVKSGALAITAAFIGASTFEAAEGNVTVIHDKGYITFRKYPGKSGYYFSDDPTVTAATDDYNSVARGRIIDKVTVLAYGIFVEEILDEIRLNAAGQMETAKAKYYQAIIENAVNTSMTANSEISGFRCFVDPTQDVLTTGKVKVECRVLPVAYAKAIEVTLGFATSLT